MATGAAAGQAGQRQAPQKVNTSEDRGPGSVAGNLVKDPELRYSGAGRPVVNLRIAASERVRNPQTQQWEDGPTTYYDVSAWGNLAENIVENLQRGDRIVAEGRWMATHYEDQEQKMQERVYLNARDLGPSMIFKGARVTRKGSGQ